MAYRYRKTWQVTVSGFRCSSRQAFTSSADLVVMTAPVGDWGEILRELPKRVGALDGTASV